MTMGIYSKIKEKVVSAVPNSKDNSERRKQFNHENSDLFLSETIEDMSDLSSNEDTLMTNDSALMSMLVEDCLEDLDRKIDLIIEMDNIAEQLDTAIEVSLEEQLHTQYEEQFEEASEAHCHALEKQLETALEREFERKAQIADIAIPRTFSRLYKSNIEGRIREIVRLYRCNQHGEC